MAADLPKSNRSPADAFADAVEIAGGQSATAKIVGVTQQSISYRVNNDMPAAEGWVLPLEAATGVSRHELRPDIYPPEPGPDHGRAELEPAR